MANVYVVTYNIYFRHDTLMGKQTTLGDVGKGDIFTFSNKDKAIKFVLDKIDEEKTSIFGCPKYDRYDYDDMWIFSQNEFNSNDIRHTWLIVKTKINQTIA